MRKQRVKRFLPEFNPPESDSHNYSDSDDNDAEDSLHPFTSRYIFVTEFSTNTARSSAKWNNGYSMA